MFKTFDMSSGVQDDADEVQVSAVKPEIKQPSVNDFAGQHLALRLQEVVNSVIPVHMHGIPDVMDETAVQRLH